MILVGITSLWLTKPELRAANGFDWEPIKEVAKTLAAISLGVVFMGVNTYIGMRANFMVYAIARRTGVNMPGSSLYGLVCCDIFAAVTWLFLA